MVLRARLSNLFNKIVRQMTILTDFGNSAYFFEIKGYFAKKNSAVVFVKP